MYRVNVSQLTMTRLDIHKTSKLKWMLVNMGSLIAQFQ